MKCPRCKRSRLVEISVTLGEHRVTMRSCSRCDIRWWESDGKSLPLPGVLKLASPGR
jgi:transcription elongation factor Elf1